MRGRVPRAQPLEAFADFLLGQGLDVFLQVGIAELTCRIETTRRLLQRGPNTRLQVGPLTRRVELAWIALARAQSVGASKAGIRRIGARRRWHAMVFIELVDAIQIGRAIQGSARDEHPLQSLELSTCNGKRKRHPAVSVADKNKQVRRRIALGLNHFI
ncbi:MAG: hypothetical protein AB7T59_04655 [Hyphomonadaceae bacterium]